MTIDGNTAAAIAEIDGLKAKVLALKTARGVAEEQRRDSWRDIADHAAALSPAAQPLARVLAKTEIVDAIKTYAIASKAAQDAQKSHRGIGARAALLGFLATMASAALLFLQWKSTTWEGWTLNLVHFVCLGAALLSAGLLWLRKPRSEWANARARSEHMRVAHFDAILDAPDNAGSSLAGALPFKVLALEYVRVYLIEDQRDWHAKRSNDFLWPTLGNAMLRTFGMVLLLAAMAPALFELLMSPALASLPLAVSQWAAFLKTWIAAQQAALLGVVGGALQTLSTSLGTLSLSSRNRRSYQRIAHMLTHYLDQPLTEARSAAVRGDERGVDRYWWAIRTELVAENRAWSEALGMSSAYLIDELPKSAGA